MTARTKGTPLHRYVMAPGEGRPRNPLVRYELEILEELVKAVAKDYGDEPCGKRGCPCGPLHKLLRLRAKDRKTP